jgi:hypothetical protein
MTAIVTWRFTKVVSFSSSRHSSANHYFIVYGYGIIINDLTDIASLKEDAIFITLSGLRCNAGGMMGFLQTKSETRISSATSNFGSWIKLLTIFVIGIKRRINM